LHNYLDSKWFDEELRIMHNYIQNGETIIINPVLQAYFYGDVFCSTNYSDVMFGKTFYHATKYKPTQEEIDAKNKTGQWPDSYYIHNEASRLVTSFKRTVGGGATVHAFYPTRFGVASHVKVAVIEDMQGDVFNMLGDATQVDALDGSGYSSPIQANLENQSLFDAKVGMDKKTIFEDTDAATGAPTLLKWAVYALTNDRRRKSLGSNAPAEQLFQKMHNLDLGSVGKIKLEHFYSTDPNDLGCAIDGRVYTERNYVYYFDYNTGKYIRIDSVRTEPGTNNVTLQLSEVSFTGRVLQQLAPVTKTFSSIYDIDQIFGGSFAMQLDPASNTLVYSDVNNKICSNIVCVHDLKNRYIGYAVQKSGIKNGTRNINLRNVLDAGNQDQLSSFSMSTMFGGVQMDADHELDGDTEVTEMSQMMSALIQGGYLTGEVNEIYSEIGSIVMDSLSKITSLVQGKDYSAVHTVLGKLLIDVFSKGRDTKGLAQTFLMQAAQVLQKDPHANINIPFSDPTVLGAFTANVVAQINKSGIRRKYAGIASVQVPSRNTMQYYNVGGSQMMFEKFAKTIANDPNKQFDVLTYIQNHGTYDTASNQFILTGNINGSPVSEVHPFITELSARNEADMGDTVLLVNATGNVEQVTLDTFENYDRVRHLVEGYKIFKWSSRPVNLRQSDTTFRFNGNTFSIYDLDSVRASHYMRMCYDKQNKVYNLQNLSAAQRLVVLSAIRQVNQLAPNSIAFAAGTQTVTEEIGQQ